MNNIKSVRITEELSELNGQIVYLIHEDGKVIRLDIPFGAEDQYRQRGIPVTV